MPKIASLRAAKGQGAAALPDARLARVVGLPTAKSGAGEDGAPRFVEVEIDNGGHPVRIPARLAIDVDRRRLERALAEGDQAALLFENGDPQRPLIVGLVRSDPTTRALAPASGPAPAPASEVPRIIQADVDGRRVMIEGRDEIVLRCGKASVTLRRNGRVVIRGTHVETDSEGTNRVKGGQVRIN